MIISMFWVSSMCIPTASTMSNDIKWSGFQRVGLWSRPFENLIIWNLDIFSRVQMVFDNIAAICPDFGSHSKSGLFANQPLFDHLKSRLVRFSDPHCVFSSLKYLGNRLRKINFYINQIVQVKVGQLLQRASLTRLDLSPTPFGRWTTHRHQTSFAPPPEFT